MTGPRSTKYVSLGNIVGATISERESCIAAELDQKWRLGIDYSKTRGTHYDAQFFSATQAVLTLGRDDGTIAHLYDRKGLFVRAEPVAGGILATNAYGRPDARAGAMIASAVNACAQTSTAVNLPPAEPPRGAAPTPAVQAPTQSQPFEFIGNFFRNLFRF